MAMTARSLNGSAPHAKTGMWGFKWIFSHVPQKERRAPNLHGLQGRAMLQGGAGDLEQGRGGRAVWVSPGRENDDTSLQLLSLQQQRRHIFGPGVKLKHFLSLWLV